MVDVDDALEVEHVAFLHVVAQRVAVAAEDCVDIVLIHDVGRALRPRARRRHDEQREQKL